MNKPKLLVNIIPIDPETKTVFIAKRVEDLKINVVSGKLKYGEEFNECASRLMKEDIGIAVSDLSRLKFVCSYNIVDKDKGIHFVGVMFYIMLESEEIKWISINKYTYSSWVFASMDDILNYKSEIFIAFQIFLNKFGITSIEDLKNIVSN